MTASVGQSMRAAMAGGRWLLKNAVACSGCENTALKNASFGWAASSVPGGNSSMRVF